MLIHNVPLSSLWCHHGAQVNILDKAGAAYLYDLSNAKATKPRRFTAPKPIEDGRFGETLLIASEKMVAIGAPSETVPHLSSPLHALLPHVGRRGGMALMEPSM